jgi:membrane protein YdbS with pleckstrin-like domain
MQEFNHIEALWAKHTVDVSISADEMLKQAKKDVNGMRTKSLLNIAGMIFSVLAFAALWLFFDFQSPTTHVGISIIIIVVAVYIIILYNNYRIISNSDFTANPKEFIKSLKRYQVNRFNLHSRLYWFYTVALSLGMVLYFFEALGHMQPWAQILIVVLSFGWMIFCSTLFRKNVIKRDRERISLLIEKFERISEQFHEHG